MKSVITLFFVLLTYSSLSQKLLQLESKVITVQTTKTDIYYTTTVSAGGFITAGTGFQKRSVAYDINQAYVAGIKVTIQESLDFIHKNLNANGYSLKSTIGNIDISGVGLVTLFFEKADSYREAELYKLINELTARIDTTSKKYTDSAMLVIQTNVLNYLQSIPNEVITQAYKDQLSKMILSEAEEKIKKVVEELKKEIRNPSNK